MKAIEKDIEKKLKAEENNIKQLVEDWNEWFYYRYPAHTGKICLRRDMLFMLNTNILPKLKQQQWYLCLDDLATIHILEQIELPAISKMTKITATYNYLVKTNLIAPSNNSEKTIKELYFSYIDTIKAKQSIKSYILNLIEEDEEFWMKKEEEPEINPMECGAKEALENAGINFNNYIKSMKKSRILAFTTILWL